MKETLERGDAGVTTRTEGRAHGRNRILSGSFSSQEVSDPKCILMHVLFLH